MITAGSGPYLTTREGTRVLDATAGATAATGDRVLLGYDWNSNSVLTRAPVLPVLPPTWERPAERQLADDVAGLLGWEYAVPAASGQVASHALAEGAVRGWWNTDWPFGTTVEVDLAELVRAENAGEDSPHVGRRVMDRIEHDIRDPGPELRVCAVVVTATESVPLPVAVLGELRRLCEEYDLILGWDESRLGLGRSGAPTMASCLPPGARPDVAAIGDIHPLAAAIATVALPGLTRAMVTAAEHGQDLRCALAARLGQHAVVTACGLDVSVVPEVERGPDVPGIGPAVVAEARRRGLLVRSTADESGARLTPALTCDHDALDAIADRVSAAVEQRIQARPQRVRLDQGHP